LGVLVELGYSSSWTGFADFTKPSNDFVRGKTLWDWLQLFLVPIFLSLGVFYLNRSERLGEREIAADRQRETVLQSYLDKIADLLLKEKLRVSENEEVRDIARIRTLTVLRGLDAKRKRIIILFLKEAQLITQNKPIISLTEANLERADLTKINLAGISLAGADLVEANLSGADLTGADLSGVDLYGGNLTNANLDRINLTGANLDEADLTKASLNNANLTRASLVHANLFHSQLYKANLTDAFLRIAELRYADLSETVMSGADLRIADLRHAYLISADLSNANLERAIIIDTILKDADLSGANLLHAPTHYNLAFVKSLKGATMPDGTKHE
jgi:uncharacterized protein YjbI with pentapeptide repeats